MRYRKQDANGDYVWGHQQNDFWVNAPDGVAQAILTRLRLFVGEWFLDVTDGTPWTTQVLDKYTSGQYDAAIQDRILGTPGVVQITSYSSSLNTTSRKLTVNATVDTQFGATTLSTTI
ncbi:hypothetical protein QF001_000942 [Paraburkholderia youngii]